MEKWRKEAQKKLHVIHFAYLAYIIPHPQVRKQTEQVLAICCVLKPFGKCSLIDQCFSSSEWLCAQSSIQRS